MFERVVHVQLVVQEVLKYFLELLLFTLSIQNCNTGAPKSKGERKRVCYGRQNRMDS